MCLAIPGKLIELNETEQKAVIDFNGLHKSGSTMLMPEVAVGDYVLVHAGFIIQIMDDDYGKDLTTLAKELDLE